LRQNNLQSALGRASSQQDVKFVSGANVPGNVALVAKHQQESRSPEKQIPSERKPSVPIQVVRDDAKKAAKPAPEVNLHWKNRQPQPAQETPKLEQGKPVPSYMQPIVRN